MSQRFEGKNLEEALDGAAQGLGVRRYQLTYHVVLEKRGFLGGMKRVVIEADINESATEPAAPAAVPAPVASRAAERTGEGRTRGGRGGGRGGRPGGGGGGGGRGQGNRAGHGGGRRRERFDEEEKLQPGDFAEFAGEIPEQGAESESAKEVRAWCERALSLAKLEMQLRSEESDSQIVIRLYGRDARSLIERHGELLDALQVLVNKAFVGRKVEKDIELDCHEFKGRRVEELEQKAKRIADEVRRDGQEQVLPAMTPIERRIVHLALRDDVEVTTESRGDGFYKRIAIVRRPPQQEQSSTAS